jgi:hypothetical protein
MKGSESAQPRPPSRGSCNDQQELSGLDSGLSQLEKNGALFVLSPRREMMYMACCCWSMFIAGDSLSDSMLPPFATDAESRYDLQGGRMEVQDPSSPRCRRCLR